MLVILESILVTLHVDNLNILQLVVHTKVMMAQKVVGSCKGLAYMGKMVKDHQQKPVTVQATILEKTNHHFQVIDRVKMRQFQVFWQIEMVKNQHLQSQTHQSNQKMVWQLHLGFHLT